MENRSMELDLFQIQRKLFEKPLQTIETDQILYEIRPILAKNGLFLIFSDEVSEVEGEFRITSICKMVNAKTKENATGCTVRAVKSARNVEICINKARRQALLGLFGVVDSYEAGQDRREWLRVMLDLSKAFDIREEDLKHFIQETWRITNSQFLTETQIRDVIRWMMQPKQ